MKIRHPMRLHQPVPQRVFMKIIKRGNKFENFVDIHVRSACVRPPTSHKPNLVSSSLWYMGSRLHVETACRNVYAAEYLSDKKIPWQRRRRLRMAVAGITPTANFLTKIGKMQ